MEEIRKRANEKRQKQLKRANDAFEENVLARVQVTLQKNELATQYCTALWDLTDEDVWSCDLRGAVEALRKKDIVVTFDADSFFNCCPVRYVYISWPKKDST
jgi:hypothetical protein